MYKALKLLTHKPKPEKKRKREVILGRSLKSSKQKRKKAQKRKAIKSQRLRREVEARAVSLMKKKDLGEIDESIRVALPHVLVGPDVWELFE